MEDPQNLLEASGLERKVMHERLLCLDIETVPDRGLMPEDWTKFPKPLWHKVVAICFVEASIERSTDTDHESYVVTACRSGGDAGLSERELLRAFWAALKRSPARVVTFHGKGFELPVLLGRSLLHGLSAEVWYRSGSRWDTYTQRFAPDWHCDLCEQLSEGSRAKMGLDELAHAFGLPGKIGGHGSEVEAMVERGLIQDVRAYGEGDVLNLFSIYVRWALLTGRIDEDGYQASLRSLMTYLEAERSSRPHLGEFLDRWRKPPAPASGDADVEVSP